MLIKNGPTWILGEVLISGPRNYKIKLVNGVVVRRHVDQMLNRPADSPNNSSTNDDFDPLSRAVLHLKLLVPKLYLLSLQLHFEDRLGFEILQTDSLQSQTKKGGV